MKKKVNTIAEFIAYVSQLNYIKVDGHRFIADNGACLVLDMKLIDRKFHGFTSGVQLSMRLFATIDGGLVNIWGSESDSDNQIMSEWWVKTKSNTYNAEDAVKEKAVKAMKEQLG